MPQSTVERRQEQVAASKLVVNPRPPTATDHTQSPPHMMVVVKQPTNVEPTYFWTPSGRTTAAKWSGAFDMTRCSESY